MKGLSFLLLLAVYVSSLSMQLTGPKTCLSLQAQDDNENWLINYHHNFNRGTATLRLFDGNQVLADSGSGRDYRSNLNVSVPHKGLYDLCFQKEGEANLQISFEVLREEEQLNYAGKEELGRLTRRIGEFLVQIKKASWQYKQVLTQHNQRQSTFHRYEADNYIIYAIKLGVMVAVLSLQIWAVRKIFD